jgi:serine/threonine-protein kinase HipA
MEGVSSRALALFFELYEALPRQGPGNEAATRRALALLPGLPPRPRIADLGCGGGASTRVLAAATGGMVAALDIHLPFLAGLRSAAGGAGAIHPVAADMAKPPLAPAGFDLVWSEGAIYQIGFAQGLQRWRKLLRPGGFLAVTEATWLTDAPPAGARHFWTTAYPAMTTIAANEATVAEAGYRLVDSFALPPECWLESYYAPLERALAPFAARHPDDPDAALITAEIRTEIDLYRRYGDSYGYVFYLAQRP